jgi:hypothetical protein
MGERTIECSKRKRRESEGGKNRDKKVVMEKVIMPKKQIQQKQKIRSFQ